MSAHFPAGKPIRAAASHVAGRLGRLAAALAAAICTLLASAAVTPTAWAVNVIPVTAARRRHRSAWSPQAACRAGRSP